MITHDPGKPGYIQFTYDLLAADYLAEIREFAVATTIQGFDQMLDLFEDYPAYLRSRKKVRNPLKPFLAVNANRRSIDTVMASSDVWQSFYIGHLSGCCELFQGSRLGKMQLSSDFITEMGRKYIQGYQSASNDEIRKVVDKLHSMDAVRTIHILRSLGLVTTRTENINQLALGAGAADKDMYAIHRMPVIEKIRNIVDDDCYALSVKQEIVNHIIVTDIDMERLELYEQFNKQDYPRTLAICNDMMGFLSEFPGLGVQKRNLVTAIRIDHRMLPDVSGFFQKLSLCVDEQCDLIMTIGAGNTLGEFEGRVDKLDEIYSVLDELGFRPVLIKLHAQGSYEEQHASLKFGNPSTSTFQILYCKINGKLLSKKFRQINRPVNQEN